MTFFRSMADANTNKLDVRKVEKIALALALQCGKKLMDEWETVEIQKMKGKHDFCTNLDLAVEKKILTELYKHFPDFNYLAEESGLHKQGSEYTWIIDPLDGTNNYQRKLPVFNTTMALQKGNEILFGIVYSPATHEVYHAIKDEGAYRAFTTLNHEYDESTKKRIQVSKETELKNAIIHLDVPRLHKKIREKKNGNVAYYTKEMLVEFAAAAHLFRSIGAGALGLAYTAQGSFDGFCDLHGMGGLWDVAAGFLLIREAGGIVTDLYGNPWEPGKIRTVAANPSVHKQIMNIVRTQ